MEVHYGIDLSGYSTRKTVIAELARENDEIKVKLDHSLSRKFGGTDGLEEALDADTRKIASLLENPESKLAVDIPIDLQGLAQFSPEGEFVWSLTKRPVDHALGAMPPLAERIGAPVARFQAVMERLKLHGLVGDRIFETYPAGSLRYMGLSSRGYKGSEILWNGSAWEAKGKVSSALQEIAERLGLVAEKEGIVLTDDGLDAIVAGLACFDEYALHGNNLIKYIRNFKPHLTVKTGQLPRGFRLVRKGSWKLPITGF